MFLLFFLVLECGHFYSLKMKKKIIIIFYSKTNIKLLIFIHFETLNQILVLFWQKTFLFLTTALLKVLLITRLKRWLVHVAFPNAHHKYPKLMALAQMRHLHRIISCLRVKEHSVVLHSDTHITSLKHRHCDSRNAPSV